MHFKMLMISDLKKRKKMGASFQLVECQPSIKRPANLYKYISKLIRRIHFLSYGKCIYKLYKCISDVKGGKKWERVFRSWNANNFSHGSSLPSSCLLQLLPPIMPVLQPLVCTSAQNAQKSCAFSPNWIFFFCKTEFSLFSDEEFLRCHC